MKTLSGHTSPETAYVVNDYPYGFRLRTQIRYWIETKKGQGQRFVSQTMNPKTGKWNKPKASTYSVIMVMVQDETNGHISYEILRSWGWDDLATIESFATRHADAIGEYELGALRYLKASLKANELITVTVGPETGEPRQTKEQVNQILNSALAAGYATTNELS